jgi:hypothetical protein
MEGVTMGAESRNMTATQPDASEQLKQANAIIAKSVDYVAQAQPTLEKYADFQSRFQKRAAEVAGVLVDRGIISRADSSALMAKLAEDEVRALDLVARLARLVGPDQLGKAADVKVASGAKLDPFELLCQPENANGSLMVD